MTTPRYIDRAEHIGAAIAALARYSQFSNRKTIWRHWPATAGEVPADVSERVIQTRTLQQQRWQRRNRHTDRLTWDRRARANWRAAQINILLCRRRYLDVPIAASWRADRRAEVAGCCNYAAFVGNDAAREAAIKATLEALPRMLRRDGWTLTKSSTDRAGHASSRYIEHASGVRVRLSDHDLPTAEDRPWSIAAQERSARYETFGRPDREDIVLTSRDILRTVEEWRAFFAGLLDDGNES